MLTRKFTSHEWLALLVMPFMLIVSVWPVGLTFAVIAALIVWGTFYIVPGTMDATVNTNALLYIRLPLAFVLEYGIWVGLFALLTKRSKYF